MPVRWYSSARTRKAEKALSDWPLKGSSPDRTASRSLATVLAPAELSSRPRSVMCCCRSATVTPQPRFQFRGQLVERGPQLAPLGRRHELALAVPHFRTLP